MYDKASTELPDGRYALPGVVVLDGQTQVELNQVITMPANALAAHCDGCGAQVWLSHTYSDLVVNHRTYCNKCLVIRKLV